MYRLDREQFVRSPYLTLWSVLAFQAGFVNAFGFLVVGRYVSHVTGFGTQIGTTLASRDFLFALELAGTPLCFIGGALCNGFLTAARLERRERPRFDISMALVFGLIASVYWLGERGWLGPMGQPETATAGILTLYVLSFLCGLQNACFAVMTKGQIRTTHLTGVSTDLGTDLARRWWGKLNQTENMLTFRVNACRLATMLAFSTGSVVSVLLTKGMGYSALAVPTVTSLAIYAAAHLIGKSLDRKFGSELERPLVARQA
jgi:uncharacterized membrane protein YoaK (UPF0700 family)